MKKTIATLLSSFLLLQACVSVPVSTHNRSTSISDRMEKSSVLVHLKVQATFHDDETGNDVVKTGWGTCSGVYIKENVILSAAHCVETPENMQIKEVWIKKEDKSARAAVIKVDGAADLLLLYTDLEGTPVHIANSVSRGQDVWVVGNPLGLHDVLTRGIISNPYMTSDDEKASFLILDAVVLPGNSGGPVVDTNGNLVGILTRSTSMLGFLGGSGLGLAVDYRTIKDFLNSK